MMKVVKTKIPDVQVIKTEVFSDNRGSFFEGYNLNQVNKLLGVKALFVQDNISISRHNVLRGLHYQHKTPQGKLVRVLTGRAFDVAVDLRKNSDTFGQWVGEILSEKNNKALWIPEGFAHGFLSLTDTLLFLYKTTDFYAPGDEYCIAWNDPDLSISWPLTSQPIISEKDMNGSSFRDAKYFL